MKIALLDESQQGIGGGWSFLRNIERGLKQLNQVIVTDPLQADIALCAGVSMVSKETIRKIKEKGVKLIVRLDNVPRNSRNRGTGTSRLKSYSEKADEVVYQCEWARNYLSDFIGKEGIIIYNGVDTDVFKKDGAKIDFGDREKTYLYSRYNRDETKNWEVAWYEYQMIARSNPGIKLVIVGKFSPELIENNFDFFRGEKIEYRGIVNDPEEMARIMRGCGYLLATYYNDCYSNTYLEARACGMRLVHVNMSGGTPELLNNKIKGVKEMAQEYLDLFEKVVKEK